MPADIVFQSLAKVQYQTARTRVFFLFIDPLLGDYYLEGQIIIQFVAKLARICHSCSHPLALATRQNLKKSHHLRDQKIARVAVALGNWRLNKRNSLPRVTKSYQEFAPKTRGVSKVMSKACPCSDKAVCFGFWVHTDFEISFLQ